MVEPNTIYTMDALEFLSMLEPDSVDLVITSPPYADVKRGADKMSGRGIYKNIPVEKYVDWFRPIGIEIKRVLKPTGSFVLNIDTLIRDGKINLYIFDLLLSLCRDVGFNLIMDYFWVKTSVMPAGSSVGYKRPRRAVEYVWHFGKTTDVKADTHPVLMEYSKDTVDQMKEVWRRQIRDSRVSPSGHSWNMDRICRDRGGSTPYNYIVVSSSESSREHMSKWKEMNIESHPAKYPERLVRFFILMLTEVNDLVCDPFMGSGTTAAVAKMTGRRWIGCDIEPEYVRAAEVRLSTVNRVVKPSNTRTIKIDEFISPGEDIRV